MTGLVVSDVSRLALQARAAQASGDFGAAVSIWVDALLLAPGFAEAWLEAGRIYQAQKRFVEAEAVLGEAVARFPANPQIAAQLAVNASAAGDFVRAVRLWRDFVAAFPERLEGGIALAELLCPAERGG
jgi:Flp pilus assembly protein TadD